MYRLYHLIFLIHLNFLLGILHVYVFLARKKPAKEVKKIAAFPYYPVGWAGGHERIENWKPYFTADHITYDVFWASVEKDMVKAIKDGAQWQKYRYYFKVLNKRFWQFFKIRKYDAVWVQRAYITLYPFKDAYFEKLIRKLNPNLVIDFYDADYESNFNLTINSAKTAKKVTVASKYLHDYFQPHNSQTVFIRFTLDNSKYLVKSNYQTNGKVVIGWMGSPWNSVQLQFIEDELQKIEQQFPQVEYQFICRENIELPKLQKATIISWNTPGFDYNEWIKSLDIGISPLINPDERSKAKTTMKSIEYMASAVPMVISPWGISDVIEHEKSALIAHEMSDWSKHLERLINDTELRSNLGTTANANFKAHHTYEKVYTSLKNYLTNFD